MTLNERIDALTREIRTHGSLTCQCPECKLSPGVRRAELAISQHLSELEREVIERAVKVVEADARRLSQSHDFTASERYMRLAARIRGLAD